MIAVVWLSGYPIRGAEAFALAFLAGVAVRRVARPGADTALPARLWGPWLLFAVCVAASATVVYGLTQFYLDFPGAFAERLLTYIVRDYYGLPGDPRPWLEPADFRFVASTALVIEGIALLLVAGRLVASTPGLARRLLATTVAAGVAAALMSIQAVIAEALATGAPLQSLEQLVIAGRVAVHVTKVNTAGSYFVMVAVLAGGLAVLDRSRRVWWIAALATTLTALWLTASLAGIVGGLVVALTAAAIGLWRTGANRRRLVTGAALLAVVASVALARTATRADAATSFWRRVAIAHVSLATAAEAPLFGVGIGQYPLRSSPHVTDEVREGFGDGSVQPHNLILRVGAELGAVGLGLFVWALIATAAFVRVRADHASLAAPAAAAVAAFFISALSGQPLLVDAVAVPFWLAAAVIVGAAPLQPAGRWPRWVTFGAAALAAALPVRMADAIAHAEFPLAGHGTTLIEVVDGQSARLVHRLDGPARLFVSGSAPAVRIQAHADEGSEDSVFLRVESVGLHQNPLLLPPGVDRTVCVPVFDRAGWAGPRGLDMTVVGQGGTTVEPGRVWVLAIGLERPCGD